MTNKERLKELEKIAENVRNNGAQTTLINLADLDLLNQQSERVLELEEERNFYKNAHEINLEIAMNEQEHNKELQRQNSLMLQVIKNIKAFPGNESEHSKMADVECAAVLEELEGVKT